MIRDGILELTIRAKKFKTGTQDKEMGEKVRYG